MKENRLPPRVLKLLKPHGIGKEHVLDVCPVDLSDAGEYISGYLFLTADTIGIVTSEPIGNRVRYFRGTKTKDMEYGEDTLEYAIRLISIEETEQMKIERMVATNRVTVLHRGVPVQIGVLTNLYLEQMNLFLKSYKKLKTRLMKLRLPQIFRRSRRSIARSVERCIPTRSARFVPNA